MLSRNNRERRHPADSEINKIGFWAPSKIGQLLSRIGQFMAELADSTGARGDVVRTGTVGCEGGLGELIRY